MGPENRGAAHRIINGQRAGTCLRKGDGKGGLTALANLGRSRFNRDNRAAAETAPGGLAGTEYSESG